MKKELTNMEVINIVSWIESLSEEKLNTVPIKIKFNLKRVFNKLIPDAKQYEDFRNEEIKKIQAEYFNDEKSNKVLQTITDEKGEPVLDDDGKAKTQEVYQIKEEYSDELNTAISDLNKKLDQILKEKNTYEYNSIDIDSFVENMPEDSPLEWNDINMLDALFTEEV